MPRSWSKKGKSASILVVDDDRGILKLLQDSLGEIGYEVFTAKDGEEALEQLDQHSIDLILLDLMLPKMNGMEVCQEIRMTRKEELPIIILSVKDKEADKVKALNLGADDYVPKPFGMQEVLARINAHLRRYSLTETAVMIGPLKVDFSKRTVQLEEQEITLTPKEYNILEHFIRHRGKIVTHDQLISKVWGNEHGADERYIQVHIHTLRKKIEPNPTKHRFIITIRGVGYRFNAD